MTLALTHPPARIRRPLVAPLLLLGGLAALVVIGSKTTRQTPEGAEAANGFHAFDAGAAWANLALQAHLSGWAAHGMGGFDPAKLAAALNLADLDLPVLAATQEEAAAHEALLKDIDKASKGKTVWRALQAA